jgi:SAM-dependent methyltransferase
MTQNEQTPMRVQSVVLGKFKIMYRPASTFEQTRTRLIQQGLHVHETAHFLVTQLPDTQSVLIVHRFSPDEIDNNIGHYLMQELTPPGFMLSDQDFRAAFIGVVTSLSPRTPVEAWNRFSLNTLHRLRVAIDEMLTSFPASESDSITSFAQIYRRLLSLKLGDSLLDVGCACAFWPILVAEQEKESRGRIMGIDNRREAITLSDNLAACMGINHLEFLQRDVTTTAFPDIGTFDTVTAIHLLEHIPEEQLSLAFKNLLKVTDQRLIIAVPYEQQATIAYGHRVVFTSEKLDSWGNWCVEYLQGRGSYWCEEVMGGMLIVDKNGV